MRTFLLVPALFFSLLTSTLFAADTFSGVYYLYQFGNSDGKVVDGQDGTFAMAVKLTSDGSGNFSAQLLADSEGDNGTFTGTYTVANGALTAVINDETLTFRISPNGEVLAGVVAENTNDIEVDNEQLRIIIKESDLSSLSGTYYHYQFGNSDGKVIDGQDGTFAMAVKWIFDGSGNFSAQLLADSEGDSGTFTGTYTVANGALTAVVDDETLTFRISPNGEVLAGVVAENTNDIEVDNEQLRIMIKESSLSSLSGTYYHYQFGNSDGKVIDGQDGTFAMAVKWIFDGSGNFSAQLLADSEGDSGTFTGTYTVANGVLTAVVDDETLTFRISPNGEVLSGVVAENTNDIEVDNEQLPILIRETSVSQTPQAKNNLSVLNLLLD